MGISIKSTIYEPQFKPASTTDWLIGNVGDWITLTKEIGFRVFEQFEITGDTILLSDNNKIIVNGSKTWKERGFFVGLDISLRYTGVVTTNGNPSATPHVKALTVTDLFDNTMTVELQTGFPVANWDSLNGVIMPGVKNADTITKNVSIIADHRIEGIEIEYAHVENNLAQSGNVASHIDGSVTKLVMENTDTMVWGVVSDFTHQLNFKSGLALEKATCEYRGAAHGEYVYRIELIFMLAPFYDNITNLVDGVAPSVLFGLNAITDIMKIKGLPIYNNPNITITNDVKKTVQLGNTGWFDENFNQLPNEFTHTDVVYTNLSGTVITALDYTNPTIVTTTISGIDNLGGLSRFQYGFIWCSQDEDTYKSNNNPYHKNQKVSTGGEADGMTDVFNLGVHSPFPALRLGYSIDGASGLDASDIEFTINATDTTAIDVSITFRPTAAFTAFIDALGENQRKYALWVSVGDSLADTNESDRVSLWLDFSNLVTYVEPIGEYDGLTINFLDHPQAHTDTPISCGNQKYVEDDLLSLIEFTVNTAVSDTNPIPTGVNVGVMAVRASDGFQYILDKSSANLTQYPNPTQYNFSQDRGFKLGAGNSKNWFKVDWDGNAGGTLEDVLVQYGYKIRWEDWIKRSPNPPSDFYLNTELQNGKNNDWFHYFNTTGWTLAFFVEIEAILAGVSVTYQNLKPLAIKDYDSNSTISTIIRTYQDNNGVKGVQINAGSDGVILNNEFVWLEIEYNSTVPVVVDWASQVAVDANVYATQCIDDLGAGQKVFRQLSSEWVSEFDNPMRALPNETLANVTWVNNQQLIVKTRIEADKLINTSRYKITGRIGCK